MCFMRDMASDNEIPTSVWNQSNPSVCFNNNGIKPPHFSKKNIYYVNSTDCCGCKFKQEDDALCPDFSEIEEVNKNQYQLHEHLTDFLKDETTIELFGCWAGSENDLEKRREIQVDELLKDDFYFPENELIRVYK